MDILHEDKYTFSIISRSLLPRIKNVSDKNRRETQLTHILFLVTLFFSKLCRLWDKVENIVELGRQQMTIWRMRIACWIIKATNIHSEYVTLIAFPRQQLLQGRLHCYVYKYIPCLVRFADMFKSRQVLGWPTSRWKWLCPTVLR
jgi:hypothetical protein